MLPPGPSRGCSVISVRYLTIVPHSPLLTLFFFLSGPEVEARIASYQARNGQVLFGGHLRSDVDPKTAFPDRMGLSTPDRYALNSGSTSS